MSEYDDIERHNAALADDRCYQEAEEKEHGMTLNLEQIEARCAAGREMVSNLCKRRGEAGSREWVMSIPARPDYDPDLVIGASLHDVPALCDEILRLRDWQKRAASIFRRALLVCDPRFPHSTACDLLSECPGDTILAAAHRAGALEALDGFTARFEQMSWSMGKQERRCIEMALEDIRARYAEPEEEKKG